VTGEYVGDDPAAVDAAERAAQERQAADDQAFADKLAKRSLPNEVERAEIERARKRTKARTPRVVMHIEDRGTGARVQYPDHSDEEGHRYRLADTFGTRSLQFVHSMLKGLGKATEDHSLNLDLIPGSSDQLAFNAALAVIDGVRPKDEIEAMLAAHMAITNITLLELVARTRGAIAGHMYQGNGIKRLDILGNLTTKFMRTYTMQVEALARKRRKGEQNVRVEHVHIYPGAKAVVGDVTHQESPPGGGGGIENERQPHAPHDTRAVVFAPGTPMPSADPKREAMSIAGRERQVSLPTARRRKR
jgi:hypothetical protein